MVLAACPSRGTPPAHPPGAPERTFALTKFVGGWRWLHRTTEAGTTRIEEERWRFMPGPSPTQLTGRYLREVVVSSDDRKPFQCNQRTSYTQRAVFDLTVDVTETGYAVKETAVRTEPGPCDHGFRRLGEYEAAFAGSTLVLQWDGGTQTLLQIDARPDPLPRDPWPAEVSLAGAWRWDASTYDREGNVQDETEWWYVTPRSDSTIDATYRRRVTVRSPDGSRIACANAASWTFDDSFVLDGQREEEHWHFHELAAEPGDHPCLTTSPVRALDEATVEQIGDALILEWRGKRRQVLLRPGERNN